MPFSVALLVERLGIEGRVGIIISLVRAGIGNLSSQLNNWWGFLTIFCRRKSVEDLEKRGNLSLLRIFTYK